MGKRESINSDEVDLGELSQSSSRSLSYSSGEMLPPEPLDLELKHHRFVEDIDLKKEGNLATILGLWLSLHTSLSRKKDKHLTPIGKARHFVGKILESSIAQYIIIFLILLDVAALVGELIIEANFPEQITAEEALRFTSISILWIFAIEQALLMFAFAWDYARHPLYILDFVIFTVSLIVELVLRQILGGFLALFLLWRVVRIVHGILVSAEEVHKKKTEATYKRLEIVKEYLEHQRFDDAYHTLVHVMHSMDVEVKDKSRMKEKAKVTSAELSRVSHAYNIGLGDPISSYSSSSSGSSRSSYSSSSKSSSSRSNRDKSPSEIEEDEESKKSSSSSRSSSNSHSSASD